MKKIFALTVAILMLLSLTACQDKTAPALPTQAPAATAAPAPTEEAAPAEEEAPAEAPAYAEKFNEQGFDEGVQIAPVVLLDNEQAKLTATSLSFEYGMANLNLELVNKTSEMLSVSCDTVSVNGFMAPCFLFLMAEGNSTVSEPMDLAESILLQGGVKTISEIAFYGFSVNNEDATGGLSLQTNAYGVVSSDADVLTGLCDPLVTNAYGYSVLSSKQERIDFAEGIYASSAILTDDGYFQKTLNFEVFNDTDETITLEAGSIYLNELFASADYLTYTKITPHCRSLFSVDLTSNVPYFCMDELDFDDDLYEIRMAFTINNGGEPVPYNFKVDGVMSGDKPDGKIVYDKDGITIQSLGLIEDSLFSEENYVGSGAAVLLITNKTGKTLYVHPEPSGLIFNGKPVEFNTNFYEIPDSDTLAFCCPYFDSLTDLLGITDDDQITEATLALAFSEDEFSEQATTVTVDLLND